MPIEEQNPDMPCASSKLCLSAPAMHRPFPHPFCPISVGFKNTSPLFSSFIFRACPRPLSPDSSSGLFSKNLALIGPLYSLPFPSVSFDVCNCSRLAWSNGQGTGRLRVWIEIWGLEATHYLPHHHKEKEEEKEGKRRKALLKPHRCMDVTCFFVSRHCDSRIIELWNSVGGRDFRYHLVTPSSHVTENQVVEVTYPRHTVWCVHLWAFTNGWYLTIDWLKNSWKTVEKEEGPPKGTKHRSILKKEGRGKFRVSAVQSCNESAGSSNSATAMLSLPCSCPRQTLLINTCTLLSGSGCNFRIPFITVF